MKLLTRLAPFGALVPMFALAAGELTQVSTFLRNIIDFMNDVLVPLIFAVAFLVFIYGVAKYFIISQDDPEAQETGKKYMLYGIVGFVIMVSVWGIVNLLAAGFGFTGENIRQIPNLPTTR